MLSSDNQIIERDLSVVPLFLIAMKRGNEGIAKHRDVDASRIRAGMPEMPARTSISFVAAPT